MTDPIEKPKTAKASISGSTPQKCNVAPLGTASPPPAGNKSNRLPIVIKDGQTEDGAVAEVVGRGVAANATTVIRFMASDHTGLSLMDMCSELQAQGEAVSRNDMSVSEHMLVAQASALNAMFNGLAKRATMNMGEHLSATETYTRLALKAQAQCARTIEVLAAMKNPPVVFAKQANISHGHQQVNNGADLTATHTGASAHGKKTVSEPIELLEHQHGERLDLGAQATTSGAHQDMATVGKVHWAKD